MVGVLAVLLASVFAAQALGRRSRRVEIAETYESTGGPIYTAVQLGCAGILALFGVGIVVLVLLSPR